MYLWQILGLIWSEVLGRYMKDHSTANNVMLDEVWALLKAPGGVGAIENRARRFRKRKAGLWMATQEVREFLDSGDTKKILSIQTYYESMWIARGLNIKYMKWHLPRTGELEEPDVEIELDDYRSYHRSKRSSLDKAK